MKPGDQVSVNDILIAYDQSHDDESIDKLLANISDDLKEEVSNLNRNVLRSKYTGWITDVKIYSASEIGELSPSLQKTITDYWKDVKSKKNLLKKYNINDPQDTAGIFMQDDKPIEKINGKIKGYDIEDGLLILIYITYKNTFGVGDKLVNYSALKGVCSEIWDLGKEPYSEFRPKEEVSAFFPPTGVLARMITSIFMAAFGNKLLIELKRKLGDIYLDGKYDYTQDFDYHDPELPDRTKN